MAKRGVSAASKRAKGTAGSGRAIKHETTMRPVRAAIKNPRSGKRDETKSTHVTSGKSTHVERNPLGWGNSADRDPLGWTKGR